MKYAGFDVGSSTINAVVLNNKGKIVYAPDSLIHFGNPVETLKELYLDIIKNTGKEVCVCFTGSAGKLIAKVTKCPFYYDTISIPAGAEVIAQKAEYIFHMGSTDPYFFEKITNKNTSFVVDHGTGTKCGGGSGILIDKQVRRFFADECKIKLKNKDNRKLLQKQLENMHKKSLENIKNASKELDVGGRCGVVIQSDMIHLQNSGEQIPNILKGMYKRIAKNYKSDVIKTRTIKERNAIATGGVFLNEFMIKALEEQLNIKINLPKHFEKIGAAGAAVKALKEKKKSDFNLEDLDSVVEAQKKEIQFAPALSSYLDKIKNYPEEEAIRTTKNGLVIYKNYSGDTILGIDGGSTTTKALISDMELNIVAEICLDTDGKPLETAQKIFKEIKEHLNIKIKGIAYTGSSGAFYHKLFTDFKKPGKSADVVKDEITCHALGVKHFNKKVDTIFECGGQDAKFTLFSKDSVKKAKMNLSCMAGTGQSMKNMLDMLGFDFESFKEYALAAKRTPIADETCAIFTEAGILKLISLGFPKEEIAAAVAYGFMGGYANKFVGNEKFGEFASAQGGPFKGLACLAALAQHTGIEIHAFPHRQLFGAFGAAIAVKNELSEDSVCKFRGLDIANMNFKKEINNCSKVINDSCGVRDCKLQIYKIGKDVIYSGGLCPKGNTDFSVRRAPDYVAMYKRLLERHLEKFVKPIYEESNERILIPRSLTFLNEKGIFYTALYKNLGFDVCISPESDDEIANIGIACSHSETCYPVKLAHGHVAWLKKHMKEGDKILLVNPIGSDKEKYKFCPYVAAAGFLAKDALHIKNKDALLPVLHFNDPHYKLEDSIKKDLDRVNKRFSKNQIKKAVKEALKEQKEFLDNVYKKGEEILNNLKDEKIFIGIGRGYTILDNKASSKVHELFASYGLHFIPSFFLKAPDYNLKNIAENMYWYQGQSMLKYNIMTAKSDNLYPVRETNFNCGTDSIMLYHEEDIMNKADKPHLVLQTDGHNSNAQFGTRTLANAEVVKNHIHNNIQTEHFNKTKPKTEIKKIVGIPYMGDSSYAVAAAFRGFGYKAEVMPTYTEKSKYFAKKLISTNTCRPFSFQIGDALAWLSSLENPKEATIFEPKAKGPCRQGQYYVMLRKFFDENGFDYVPIISPDADNDYTNVPIPKLTIAKLSALSYKGIFCSDVLYDALLRTRPYEKEKGSADKEYNLLKEELYKLIENKSSTKELIKFMKKAKKRFEVLLNDKKRKPFVVVNGEIFVRCHKNANQDSIKLLEKYGLEVILVLPSQWLNHVNKFSIETYKDSKNWKKLFTSLVKRNYIKYITTKLYAPFEDYLKGRKSHDPSHIVNASQKDLIYEKKIGGESPLSIGEAYLFTKGDLGDICGIYHVGPFGCMHETVATSKINAIIQKQRLKEKKIIPFMDAVFGDSELPNLEAEIAAFAEKCYLKKKLEL